MSDSHAPIHSTGRGGAGNIGPDSTVYTDGGIVREGYQGESTEGEYSTGRGGAGNFGKSPRLDPQEDTTRDGRSVEYVPETALREHQENYHTGRGGSGNVHKEKYGGHSHSPDRQGFGEKVKHALHLDKEKDGGKKGEMAEPSPLHNETKE